MDVSTRQVLLRLVVVVVVNVVALVLIGEPEMYDTRQAVSDKDM